MPNARTMELCAAAVAGREPEDLTEEERELFARLVEVLPAYLELTEEPAFQRYYDHYGDLHHGGPDDDDRDSSSDNRRDKDPDNM